MLVKITCLFILNKGYENEKFIACSCTLACTVQFVKNMLSSTLLLKRNLAFSLVEMLMALLVASLLLAALAPVMTKRMNENIHITGEFTQNGSSEIKEISYGDSKYCNDIIRDTEGNELYCEGEYTVPQGFKNITVTAIGAGGGGGTAPTAGYILNTQ